MDRSTAPARPAHQPLRLAGLDALRGMAAVGVCLFHWEHMAFGTPNAAQLFRFGLLGVELFFVISGFVILMVAERTVSVRDFVRARVIRLYPAYLLSVGLTALYVLSVGKYDAGTVLINATMLQSFVDVPNIANPYWTLAFEISFYATLALVLRFGLLRHIEVLALGWLALAACYRFALPGWMSFDPQHPLAQASYIVAAPQFAPFFVLGMMAFRVSRRQLGKPGMAAIAAALLLTLQGRGDFAQVPGPVYAAFAALSLVGLLTVLRLRGTDPVTRLLGRLGIVSYPLYLVHCTVTNLCVAVLGARMATPVAVLLSIPLAIGLAVWIHERVETPLNAWFKRRAVPDVWTVQTST